MKAVVRTAISAGAPVVAAVLVTIAIAPLARHDEVSIGASLRLLAPRFLLLLAAVPLLALVRSVSPVERAISSRAPALALGLRALLCAMVMLALARPAWRVAGSRPCTVALADVSASIDDGALAAERSFIDALRRQPTAGDTRLITFAASPRAVAVPAGGAPLVPLVRPTSVDEREASDPAAALAMVPALCGDGAPARAVLISDGNETRGDLVAQAAALAGRVRLDVRAIGGDAMPLRVRSLSAPPTALLSAPFVVEAEVESPRAGPANIELLQGENVAQRARVELTAGVSRHPIRVEIGEPGTVLLRARIAEAAGAPHADAVAAVVVKGRPRVLYVDGEEAARLPLPRLLRGDGFEVETRVPAALAESARDLARYDLLVLSDVEGATLGRDWMAAAAAFVDAGGGLLFAGGERVHGSGYAGGAFEGLLPVRFDVERRRDDPRLALVLAIDRSESMQGEKLAMAKEAARATASLLRDDDLISVVAFDAQASAIVSLAPARNRQAIADTIARVQAGGGTSFLAPLREAYDQLATARASVRHVILLTDGQASYEGIAELCAQMARDSITISAVGVGPGADRTLLSMIAARGSGRFFFADDPQSVPQIFARDAKAAAGSAPLVETGTRVRAMRPSRVLAGVELADAPRLRGYVASRAKPDAEVLLVADSGDGNGTGDPILARRRAGAGQVAVWTSDLKARWAADWIAWPGFARLLIQLARATARPKAGGGAVVRATSTLHLAIERDGEGEQLVAWADVLDGDERLLDDLDSTIDVREVTATGGRRALPLSQVAPGRYRATLPIDEGRAPTDPTARPVASEATGSAGARAWVVDAVHNRGGEIVASSTATVARPRAMEHERTVPDTSRLVAAAARTGGRLVDASAVLDPLPPARRVPRELRSWLLLAAAALLCIDLLARRLPTVRIPPR